MSRLCKMTLRLCAVPISLLMVLAAPMLPGQAASTTRPPKPPKTAAVKAPEALTGPPISEAPIFVPDANTPAIHGPRVVGFSPNRPFLYRVPATGQAPLAFAAAGLPPGLTIDPASGIITGRTPAARKADATITVTNARGRATRVLSLLCGDGKLAQTPPMGWYASGIYGDSATDARVRDAADALVRTGLAAHGYTYLVLGDSWQGTRDGTGRLQPNAKFPDMKALADYVHGKGLKLGLYTATTPQTCSGFPGSGGHEAQDARTFAAWGIDYVTADWCPNASVQINGDTPAEITGAFGTLGSALSKADRDMVYAASLPDRLGSSKSAASDVKPISGLILSKANSFEAIGGLFDDFKTITKYATDRIASAPASGTGHWNSLGLLFVGRTGYPKPKYTALTPAGQMVQMTMWSMMSTPLFFSSDLEHLNPNGLNHYTTALLTNDEVLAIDQDPLGKPPVLLVRKGDMMIWTKSLFDGRVAVALFNTGNVPRIERVAWSALGFPSTPPARDIWNHRDLAPQTSDFESNVPAHGVTLIVAGKANAK